MIFDRVLESFWQNKPKAASVASMLVSHLIVMTTFKTLVKTDPDDLNDGCKIRKLACSHRWKLEDPNVTKRVYDF